MRGEWLEVTSAQALRFFFEHLKDVAEDDGASTQELLYNASVLAHFATTSTASAAHFPPSPSSLSVVFDLFMLDPAQGHDPELLEAAASQCLLLTGFFQDQSRHRHNPEWFAALGAGFYDQAARFGHDHARIRLMATMAARFEFWRRQQRRLARELRERPRLVG